MAVSVNVTSSGGASRSITAQMAAVEARARAAGTVAELLFSIANDAYELLPFRQALVMAGQPGRERLQAISGLAKPTENSPYLGWLRRSWPWVVARLENRPGWFEPLAEDPPPQDVEEGWQEWWPRGLFALPLKRRDGQALGWVCFLLEQPPTLAQARALRQVSLTWSYCWEMLGGKPNVTLMERWRALKRPVRGLVLAVVVLLLLLPVRQTALAPGEVVARDAVTVAAPLDGVIKAVHVRPNQRVKQGEALFSLDDTSLRSRLEVALRSVAVADAEYLSAAQQAFDHTQSRSELAMLSGRAHERRAELAGIQAQLDRVEVIAARDGVVVFGDPDDWLGRPVSTGERIMQLADPGQPGVLIHVSVADALGMEPGAPVKLFLTTRPLAPLTATVTETSYQAVLSPEGVASYRLRAAFDDEQAHARIGLRGTAKLYGERVTLIYYLMRRPLATLREWTGL